MFMCTIIFVEMLVFHFKFPEDSLKAYNDNFPLLQPSHPTHVKAFTKQHINKGIAQTMSRKILRNLPEWKI